DEARVAFERPLELADAAVAVHDRDVGRGVDPLAVREAPVVEQPAVERLERAVDRFGVALERLLHADSERREEERLLDPQLRHHLEPRVAVAVFAADRLELAERLADRVALRIAAAVVLVEAAGTRHRIERGIGDEAVDRTRDEEL